MKKSLVLILIIMLSLAVSGCVSKTKYDNLAKEKGFLEKRCNDLASEKASLASEISGRDTEIQSRDTEIQSLKSQLSDAQNQINDLNEQISAATKAAEVSQ